MWNARLDEAQAGIKIARRNINNLRNADSTTVMAESEEQLKSLLKVKEESGKSWLKTQHLKTEDHGIWSHHFMGNRWGNNGNSVRLFFLAPKSMQMVTAAMKLKTRTPWKESYDQPRWHIQKRRHILPTKVRLVKAMVLQWSCMDVKVGLWRKLSTEELILLNCGAGEDSCAAYWKEKENMIAMSRKKEKT